MSTEHGAVPAYPGTDVEQQPGGAQSRAEYVRKTLNDARTRFSRELDHDKRTARRTLEDLVISYQEDRDELVGQLTHKEAQLTSNQEMIRPDNPGVASWDKEHTMSWTIPGLERELGDLQRQLRERDDAFNAVYASKQRELSKGLRRMLTEHRDMWEDLLTQFGITPGPAHDLPAEAYTLGDYEGGYTETFVEPDAPGRRAVERRQKLNFKLKLPLKSKPFWGILLVLALVLGGYMYMHRSADPSGNWLKVRDNLKNPIYAACQVSGVASYSNKGHAAINPACTDPQMLGALAVLTTGGNRSFVLNDTQGKVLEQGIIPVQPALGAGIAEHSLSLTLAQYNAQWSNSTLGMEVAAKAVNNEAFCLQYGAPDGDTADCKQTKTFPSTGDLTAAIFQALFPSSNSALAANAKTLEEYWNDPTNAAVRPVVSDARQQALIKQALASGP